MRIAVSACLLGHNCKYSGGNNRSQKVLDYIEGYEVIPICPEVAGGMSVPRVPVELKGAKAVLDPAALTYVASAISSLLQRIRLLLIARRNDRD